MPLKQLTSAPNPFLITKEVFLLIWRNRMQVFGILAWPVLAILITYLVRFIPKIGSNLSFIGSFSNILMISFLSVYWYRLILLDEKINFSIIPFRFGPFEIKYALVHMLFNTGVSLILMPGIGIILKSLGLESESLQLHTITNLKPISSELFNLIGGIVYILIIQLISFKFSFIFPNTALGKPIKIMEIWTQTEGITFRLILSTILTLSFPVLIGGGMIYGLIILNHSMLHKGMGLATVITLLALFQHVCALFVISVTALYYRFKSPYFQDF